MSSVVVEILTESNPSDRGILGLWTIKHRPILYTSAILVKRTLIQRQITHLDQIPNIKTSRPARSYIHERTSGSTSRKVFVTKHDKVTHIYPFHLSCKRAPPTSPA